jgi:hypothetical protein
VAVAAGLIALVVMVLAVTAPARTHVRVRLSGTVHAPGASGAAKLAMQPGSHGKFTIKARHLPGGKSFDVIVNGVRVGTLVTGGRGKGTARFTTAPKGSAAILGFDPRGAQIVVRNGETGDDDLEGNMPDDQPGSAIGCCLGDRDDDDDREVECRELTATACAQKGGTATTATGCLPNPCESQPPTTVVCCLAHSESGAFVDDDPEVECEDDVSQAKCAARGGTVVQATSCEPNPCQPVPPPNLVVCCVSENDQGNQDEQGDQDEQGGESQHAECEHITADRCTAAGGTVSTATSCDPDPCSSGVSQGGDGNND